MTRFHNTANNKFSADLTQLKAAKVEAMNKPGSAGSK